VIDVKDFQRAIGEIVSTAKCSYTDAVLEYQLRFGVEVETVSSLVKKSPVLKACIEEEMTSVRMLKTGARLKFK
jgi:hypothetical protein